MFRTSRAHGSTFTKLLRFLFWYAIAVGVLLYLLPLGARALEGAYDALTSTVKFFSVLGVFAVVAVWYVMAERDRWSRLSSKKSR